MSKKVEPFRFWCQTVLPLVYDDSLSYYELLCKVVEYLNQVIAQTNINSAVVAELYDYVHNYFESSDFRQLVNDKLDEMAEDGTLSELLEQFINGNLELSTNASVVDENSQTTIRGDLDGAIVCDLDNYYVSKTPSIAKKDTKFTASQEQRLFGIKNADNNFLIPYDNGNQMVASGDPMGALLCMASFVNKGMTYGRAYGLFNTDPEQTAFRQMVCSDFVACGLRGISINNSKYNGCTKNFESAYKSRTWKNNTSLTAPEDKDTLITREMAYIFASYGALWELDYTNYSNVQPGDVLFFGYYDDNNEAKNNYLSIHHCSVVLDVDVFGHRITVLESGEPSSVLFDYCYNRHTDERSGYSADAPVWDAETTYSAGDVVNHLNSFGIDNTWVAKVGNTDKEPTENSNYWASKSTGPSIDSLNISRSKVVARRHIYVARPAWPNIRVTPVITETVTDETVYNTAGDYMSIHTFPKSYYNFKKGDIVVMKIKSDLNKLDTGSNTNTVFRIDGAAPDGVYNTLWHSITNNTWHDIPNDRIVYFVIDSDDYTSFRLLLKSAQTATINSEITVDIYRL